MKDPRNIPAPPEGLTLEELEAYRLELEKQIEQQQLARRKQALDQIQQLITDNKLDPREVASFLEAKAKRSKAPAKYRNPANARQTWSGKGAPPQWYLDAPDKEALLIANETA